jgi:hypothetical protein
MVMHPLTLPSLSRVLGSNDSLFFTSWSLSSGLVDSDSASSHTSKPVQRFMEKTKMAVTPHNPHSSDLALYSFFLFPIQRMNFKVN